MNLRLIALATTLAGLGGACDSFDGASHPPDAWGADSGVDAAGTEPENEILVLSESHLLMDYASSAEVRVLLLEGGVSPLGGAEVRFTLHGRANDSSLSHFSAKTDADGTARVSLHSGRVESTFTLRAAADEFEPAHVSITVSSGDLAKLTVRPLTSLASVRRQRVQLYGEASCASERVTARDFDHTSTVWEGGVEADFPYLPAMDTYSVTVEALDSQQRVVALRCVDEVTLEPEGATLEVPLDDHAVEASGEYESLARLSLGGAPAAWATVMKDAMAEHDDDSDAALIVDAIAARLAAAGDDPGLAALETARESITSGLSEVLGERGPRVAIITAFGRFGEVEELVSRGSLSVGSDHSLGYAEAGVTWLRGGGSELDASPIGGWFAEGAFASPIRAELALTGEAPPSRWVEEFVAAERAEDDWLVELAGCEVLPTFEPLLALETSCEAGCLLDACEGLVGDLFQTGLAALDAAFEGSAPHVSGEVAFGGATFASREASRLEGEALVVELPGAASSAPGELEGERAP